MTWHTALLSEVADLSLGKMLDKAKNKGEALPYLANINVRWGNFDLEDLRTMRFEAHEVERYSLKAGDIVMCEGGEPGRCALWSDQNKKMMLQKALHRIRPKQQINSTYLYYYFLNTGKHNGFTPYFTGATIKHLPREQLAKIPIRFPCKTLQKKIGATLSSYDNLIATNQRRIALLEEAARLIYREWFINMHFPGHDSTPMSNGAPEGWATTTLGNVCTTLGGGTPSTKVAEYWNGNVTWVTPTDVTRNNSIVLLDSEKKISESGLKNSSAKLLPPETILMTSRASIGYFALMDYPVCTNQGFISIIPEQDHSRMYLLFNLMNRIEEMTSLATGSTFKELSKRTFKSLTILWPDNEILEKFNDAVYPMIQQIRMIKKQNSQLAQARDLLLPKLMSGQIDVSNIRLPDEDVVT